MLGIDPSLTRTAAVLIPPGWVLGHWPSLRWVEIEVPPTGYSEKNGDSRWSVEMARVDRMVEIVKRLVAFVPRGVEVEAAVEMYAFGANARSVTMLAELGGILRASLYVERNIVPEPVSPQAARKFLLGKLPRKDQKLAAHDAMLRHGVPWRTADTSDAFICGNYMLSELGLTGLCLA